MPHFFQRQFASPSVPRMTPTGLVSCKLNVSIKNEAARFAADSAELFLIVNPP
jgi:hypothetical protein